MVVNAMNIVVWRRDESSIIYAPEGSVPYFVVQTSNIQQFVKLHSLDLVFFSK